MTHITLLYGSSARGDSDSKSDVDLLTLNSNIVDPEGYSWGDIESMHSRGSLFVLHLLKEGVLTDFDSSGLRRWQRMRTDEFPEYQGVRTDIRAFRRVSLDVRESLRRGDTSLAYEAGVAARMVRHLSILLTYVHGAPEFTRIASVYSAGRSVGVSPPRFHFERLYVSLQSPGDFGGQPSDVLSWLDFADECMLAVGMGSTTQGGSS